MSSKTQRPAPVTATTARGSVGDPNRRRRGRRTPIAARPTSSPAPQPGAVPARRLAAVAQQAEAAAGAGVEVWAVSAWASAPRPDQHRLAGVLEANQATSAVSTAWPPRRRRASPGQRPHSPAPSPRPDHGGTASCAAAAAPRYRDLAERARGLRESPGAEAGHGAAPAPAVPRRQHVASDDRDQPPAAERAAEHPGDRAARRRGSAASASPVARCALQPTAIGSARQYYADLRRAFRRLEVPTPQLRARPPTMRRPPTRRHREARVQRRHLADRHRVARRASSTVAATAWAGGLARREQAGDQPGATAPTTLPPRRRQRHA